MRKRTKKTSEGGAGWLVTFSDLMTLLLTFFVLLLSMSSMDTTTITRISAALSLVAHADPENAGRIPERIQEVVELLRDPENAFEKQQRIKDLLFPYDILPPEVTTGDIEENIRILEHPEGVVIVLTDGLVFEPNSSTLDGKGKKLLELLYPVIVAVNTDVNISGFTDNIPPQGISNDDLSALRALAVLEHFLHGNLKPDRFSVSGYGADKPMYGNDTEENRAKNRRVEILIKTAKAVGRYIQ